MKTTFIYFLKDPENPTKGYVGKTDNPKARLSQHRSESYIKTHPRASWIKSLAARGLKPTIEVIDEVPYPEWEFWEKEYIRVFTILGFALVNVNAGGGGVIKHSQETRQKMRIAKLGTKQSAEHRAKKGAALAGKKRAPGIYVKIWAARAERKEKSNTSGFIGVSWEAKRKKWKASHTVNGKQINLGRFSNLEDAVFVRALTRENVR